MEMADIQSDIDKLKSVRSQIKVWRTIFFILAVAILVICVSMIVGSAQALAKAGAKQDEFVQKLGAGMQKGIVPKIQEIGARAIHSVDLNGEIAKLNKRAPEVANEALKQANMLSKDIPEQGREILKKQFETALQGRAAKLKEAFPDATEEQVTTCIANLTEETQNQLAEVTDTLFAKHLDSMQNILDDLETIKASEGASAKGEVPTVDMAFTLVDIMRADFEDMGIASKDTAAGKEKAQ